MQRPLRLCVVFGFLAASMLVIGWAAALAAQGQDIGLPIYPGAKPDPAYPPLKTPFMQNMHLLSDDPFEKVLAWYTGKLGKFTRTPSKRGQQALWDDKNPQGGVRTVTISTINAPAGKVRITLTKGVIRK